MRAIKVLIPKNSIFPLTYLLPDDISVNIGDLVIVPFRKDTITGIVWDIDQNSEQAPQNLKTILSKGEFSANIGNMLPLIQKVSDYYIAELGTIAKLVLPVDVSEKPITTEPPKDVVNSNFNLSKLSNEQKIALEEIWYNKQKPSLLKGVTGSGKTEVYFHLIARHLQADPTAQILILLPEIALSSQIINRFEQKFGFACSIWNSSISKAKKKRLLRSIICGNASVIIGARSSLFLPYKNLKLIIIDEEHDHSYKQTDGIPYHARDMGILRSNILQHQIVLCSATPSIETINNINLGKYNLVELKKRYHEAELPKVEIIDMSRLSMPQNRWISKPLEESIKHSIASGKQVLLFLNRKGYAPVMLCKSCGYRFHCDHCSSYMVVHKQEKKLKCHHCGHNHKISDHCPGCNSRDSLAYCGPGIERIYEEAKILFPDSKIVVMSRNQNNKPEDTKKLLLQIEKGEIDILIGTQLITKGYHFPNLTLVGIIDADLGLAGGDLRCAEKMYQLLHQVAGRAGRESKDGRVLLQSYNPDNPLFLALANQMEEDFIKTEIDSRKDADMPPFSKMASILITGKNQMKVAEFSKKLFKLAPKSTAKILGPSESIMLRISGKYRYRLLIIADKKFNLQSYLKLWLEQIKIPSYLQLKIDIDPYNFV